MFSGYFWAYKYAIVPLIPWPTRWTGLDELSIVCLSSPWTISISHDSSRSCSKDHLFTSKCWPKLCAVRLNRQYSDGWRSIQSIFLVFIWFYFSYLLMLLIVFSLRVDVLLYSLSHLGRSGFIFWSRRKHNFAVSDLLFDPCNQLLFDWIGFWFVIQHALICSIAYFVEAWCIQILIHQANLLFLMCFHWSWTFSLIYCHQSSSSQSVFTIKFDVA